MPASVRAWFVALAIVAVLAPVATPSEASCSYDGVIQFTFPVYGDVSYIDDYHFCRGTGCERRHRATDIMAPYGAPVHAAMGGRIRSITGLDGPPPSYGYMISIDGDDGRRYNYIHLGTQTGSPSEAYAPGMARGTRVQRGEWIGYNGCSGNASCSAPHLHY
jgi:murein DD-endopeptidase MepM/ murein hydrolase activator NlpD